MDDIEIIELYWERDEIAIRETNIKYEKLLYKISYNILSNHEDSQECVNDTYVRVWNSIPPERPRSFIAYLGRIVRNLSIDYYNKNKAKKRYSGGDMLLSELEECIPSSNTVWMEVESNTLTETINSWLHTLPREDRILFVRRYWYGYSIQELADSTDTTPNKLASRMYRLRSDLKDVLEKEEVEL
ncbi:MAG: sigma-70 family RNA polymerase sigma factor [Gudongella sp.]|jgi:RNA polymerase sigma-70 factor (ECF subfamily)|nr:sigma-70 family RNA polymerase sigma factor [Gudongella sp.]